MMGWNGGGWGVGSWIGMGIGMLLFWGLVVFAVVVLLRWASHGSQRGEYSPTSYPAAGGAQLPPAAGAPAALQTLDERFARGDLSEEDYRHRRDVLLDR